MAYWKCENFVPTTWQVKRYNCRFFAVPILFLMKRTVHFLSYFTYGLLHILQISVHSKSDTDEEAL